MSSDGDIGGMERRMERRAFKRRNAARVRPGNDINRRGKYSVTRARDADRGHVRSKTGSISTRLTEQRN